MKTTAAAAVLLSLTSLASAQTGTLDQVSPVSNASFNTAATVLTWQIQIRPGLAGTLEGVKFQTTGSAGQITDLRLRDGAGWSGNPVLLSTQVIKSIAGVEDIFVNLTAANYTQTPGQPFVIELQGTGGDLWMNGSFVTPPMYPEPVFLNGGPYPSGWCLGFETYVLESAPCYPDCNADGTLNLGDFGCFQTKFALGDPYADCNGDGNLNLGDFGCFQTKFALGCP